MTPLQSGDPRRLGRWRLLGRLGAGGMGVVYLARGRRNRRVAIKVPRADLARDPGYRERFRREAEAASAVAARCTARVLEVEAEGKRPYIVTEYVDGPTLHAAVTGEGPLTGPDLAAFAVGVAEALAAMHVAGVTHRDLTPGNVILGRWGPKVIDFGIARADDASTLTQTGMRIGTPAWMAPEQARGQRVTSAADTFSWGILVAYAGTGRHPFGDGRADAVIYRIVHESPDLDGLEPALLPLVERALDKDPVARPSPAHLLDALTSIEAAIDVTVGGIVTMPVTATKVMTAPPAPPVAAPPRSAPPAPPPPRSPRRVPATPPPGPPRRRRWGRPAALAVLVLLVGTGLGAGIALLLDRDDAPDSDPAPATPETTTTTEPPRSLAAYCPSAEDYYERLDAFESQFDSFPFPFPLFPPDDEEYETALIEFAGENGALFAEMRARAPLEISDDVAIVADAYDAVAAGDVAAIDTLEFLDAQDRVAAFDEDECGVDRGIL